MKGSIPTVVKKVTNDFNTIRLDSPFEIISERIVDVFIFEYHAWKRKTLRRLNDPIININKVLGEIIDAL